MLANGEKAKLANEFILKVLKPGKIYLFKDLCDAVKELNLPFSSSTLSNQLVKMTREGSLIRLTHGVYMGISPKKDPTISLQKKEF